MITNIKKILPKNTKGRINPSSNDIEKELAIPIPYRSNNLMYINSLVPMPKKLTGNNVDIEPNELIKQR